VKGASNPVFGASHGSDIPYFFGFSNETDWVATDAVSKYYSLSKVFLLNKYQFTSPVITIQTPLLTQ
jgi:hypothetical protein